MKKFEPHYRLVRVGMADKIERASRQQSMSLHNLDFMLENIAWAMLMLICIVLQGNNVRTGRRSLEGRLRRRVRPRIRRSKGARLFSWVGFLIVVPFIKRFMIGC